MNHKEILTNKIAKSTFASPLRYPGGKTCLAFQLSKIIAQYFPKGEKITLIEPYAGGAGASLKLLFSGKVNKIIINDLDRAIYSFWKTAIREADYLINNILKVDINIKEWEKQKEIYSNPTSNIRDLAFATLFLNRTNRSGIIEGGPIGGMKQAGYWDIRARFPKNTIVKRLKKIKKYKSKVKVYNLDGIELLKNLENKCDINNCLIFLDPPYYEKGKSLYLNHYNNSDHEELEKYLANSSFKWIMTYDDVPYIRKLYCKMRKKRFVINHSAYVSRKGKEVLIYSNAMASLQ